MGRKKIFFLIFQFFFELSLGQNQVQVFVGTDGKRYSPQQRDSLEQAGNYVGKKETQISNDTAYTSIYFFDRSLLLSPFQRSLIGKPLPSFKLRSTDGKIVTNDSIRNRIAMVVFWSTSCGPCIAEFPQLNQLRSKYNDRVSFITMAPEKPKEVARILKKFPLQLCVLPNGSGLMDQLGIKSYPVTFFVDRTGIVRAVKEGVPVRRSEKDGTLKFIPFEEYSKIIEEIVSKEWP